MGDRAGCRIDAPTGDHNSGGFHPALCAMRRSSPRALVVPLDTTRLVRERSHDHEIFFSAADKLMNVVDGVRQPMHWLSQMPAVGGPPTFVASLFTDCRRRSMQAGLTAALA